MLGCIRVENAVGWALDPSPGLSTPRRLEQQLKHFIVPPASSLVGVGVVKLRMKNVRFVVGADLRAVTVLPNTEHEHPFLGLRRRTHFVLGEVAPQTRRVSLSARLSYTEEGNLLLSRCDKTVN